MSATWTRWIGRPGIWLLGLFALAALLVVLGPREWFFVGSESRPAQDAEASDSRWACVMFCVLMDRLPADNLCPVCGMELEEVLDQETLDRHEQHMIGLAAEALTERKLEVVIRQVGEVDYDETALTSVTTRVKGFLEEVHVDETWVAVAAGQELAELYSDELFSIQGEYLIAWRRAGQPEGLEEVSDATRRADLEATTQRLHHLGIDDREIAAIRASGAPRRTLALRAPRAGVVIRRSAVAGAGVMPGQELYALADLSRVWIQVEVFEHELPWVAIGQRVVLRAETRPGEEFAGTVAFFDPVVDRRRRTARLRIVADNPVLAGGRRLFLPGQRVDAMIRARLGADALLTLPGEDGSYDEDEIPALLAIPRSAVLHTGKRAVAFVLYQEVMVADESGAEVASRDYWLAASQLPPTVGYELVELRLGPRAVEVGGSPSHSFHPVLGVVPPPLEEDPDTGEPIRKAGLVALPPGYLVVSAGNFLLDSQAQLAGKPSLFFPKGAAR